MKKFFAQLRPMERRLAVGVLVVLIIVLNWVFIWPHFTDWSNLSRRKQDAEAKLKSYQVAIVDTPKYEELVKVYEKQGQFVAQDDQSINILRTVQMQAAASGFTPNNYGRSSSRTNEFFTEVSQGIGAAATDAQLIDFLYKLGSGASMMRVRDLDLQPDAPRQHLNANMTLVASYQKKPVTSAAAPPAPAAAPAPATAAPKPTIAPPAGIATNRAGVRTVPTKLPGVKTK